MPRSMAAKKSKVEVRGAELGVFRGNLIFDKNLLEKKADELRKSVINSCALMNVLMDLLGLPFLIDYRELNRLSASQLASKWRDTIIRVHHGKHFGACRKPHIYTSCLAISHYFRYSPRGLILLGAMQLGKTTVFLWMFLLLPAMEFLRNRKLTIPYLSIPDDNNLRAHVVDSLKTMTELYSDVSIVFTSTGVRTSVSIPEMQSYMGYVYGEVFGNRSGFTFDCLIHKRNNCNHREFSDRIRKIADRSGEIIQNIPGVEGIGILAMVDESHYGSAVGSISDLMDRFVMSQIGKIESCRNICISATPSDNIYQEEAWKCVPMFVDEEYLGPLSYGGIALNKIGDFQQRLPQVRSFETDPMFHGIEKDFDVTKFTGHGGLSKKDLGKYRDRFADSIVQMCQRMYESDKEAFVIFFRIPNRGKKNVCPEVVEEVEKAISRMGLSEEFGVLNNSGKRDPNVFGKHGERTIGDVLIDNYISRRKRVVVFVDQRGRMGDALPIGRGFSVDLTIESMCWNTILQGTFGRMCGYGNKHSICFFYSEYAHQLNQFIANGFYDESKRMCPRSNYASGTNKRGRKSTQLTIDRSDLGLPSYIRDIFEATDAMLRVPEYRRFRGHDHSCDRHKIDLPSGNNRRKYNTDFNFHWRNFVMTPSVMDKIEKDFGVVLARYGDTWEENGRKSQPSQWRYAEGSETISVRFITSQEENNQQGHGNGSRARHRKHDGFESAKQKKGEFTLVIPQIIFSLRKGVKCKRCGKDTATRVIQAYRRLMKIEGSVRQWYNKMDDLVADDGRSAGCCFKNCEQESQKISMQIHTGMGNDRARRFLPTENSMHGIRVLPENTTDDPAHEKRVTSSLAKDYDFEYCVSVSDRLIAGKGRKSR